MLPGGEWSTRPTRPALRCTTRPPRHSGCGHAHLKAPSSRLLETFGRAGVWPDSVQVPGGTLSLRLPTSVIGVAQHRSAVLPGAVPVCG